MAKTVHVSITPRDHEIFSSLIRDPKTADLLYQESQTFENSFRSLARVQRRLKSLVDAGLLNRWRYADSTGGASPYYYKVARETYRLHCGNVDIPPRRWFGEISLSLQRHAQDLAKVNVHTFQAAKRAGVRVTEFYPDGLWTEESTDGLIVPDSTYEFELATGKRMRFYFELDESTETLIATNDSTNSIERKIRRYEQLHYRVPSPEHNSPFRVCFLCTRSRERATHIIEASNATVQERRRSIFYSSYVPSYLAERHALHAAVFLDQRMRAVSLLPQIAGVTIHR